MYQNNKSMDQTRAVDPDPLGYVFIFPPRSGSGREKEKGKNRKNVRKLVIIGILLQFVQ